jgi:hypothetical protein
MLIDISMPTTIGTLRDTDSEQPDLARRSDSQPPATPPRKPAIAGSEATKPAFRMVMWRSCTR